jgi:hypothetical protein
LGELSWPVSFLAWVVYDPTPESLPFNYIPSPLESATLFFDGGEERQAGSGQYFQVVQPWYRSPRGSSRSDVGLYSFALDSSSRAPNGVCSSFSPMSFPTLRVTLTPEVAAQAVQLKVWASTLNWLVFQGGSVSTLFSN